MTAFIPSVKAHCLRMGANLVSIHSGDEYQWVKALIRAHDQKENPTWIGLSDCQEVEFNICTLQPVVFQN